MKNQISLFPKNEVKLNDNCYTCKNFSDLKDPRELKGGAIIYGYCFKTSGVWVGSDHKGYAVYIPEGCCREYKNNSQKNGKRYRYET